MSTLNRLGRQNHRPRSNLPPPFFAVVAAGLIQLGLPGTAFAYPELIRHGYSNCISCHVSPYGGGVLTPYGRQLMGEVLTTWANENEGNFAFGSTPDWLLPGGDLRTLNLMQEQSSGNFINSLILMQADLEAAARYQKWTVDATIGRLDTAIYPTGSSWISRRHYLMYQSSDELSFQAGRFQVPYGINMPDHYAFTKEGLNWDTDTETYNLQVAWLTEKYNVFVSGSLGRPDDDSLDSGVDVTGSLMLTDKIKLGASYHYGTNDFANRNVFGPWGLIGLGARAYILAELDFQRYFASTYTEAQWGLANYVRADIEPIQGLHFFGTQEALKSDFNTPDSLQLRYGAGTQWFLRPHYDVEFVWQTQQTLSIDDQWREILWLMLHFYP